MIAPLAATAQVTDRTPLLARTPVTPVQASQDALARALLPLFVFLMDATDTPITTTTEFPRITLDQLVALTEAPPAGLDDAVVTDLRSYLVSLPFFNAQASTQAGVTQERHRELFRGFLLAWSRRATGLHGLTRPA